MGGVRSDTPKLHSVDPHCTPAPPKSPKPPPGLPPQPKTPALSTDSLVSCMRVVLSRISLPCGVCHLPRRLCNRPPRVPHPPAWQLCCT